MPDTDGLVRIRSLNKKTFQLKLLANNYYNNHLLTLYINIYIYIYMLF